MSRLSEVLSSGEFAVTCELNPPKGADLGPLFKKAESLRGSVTAFNLTDSAGSNMSMAPIGAARLLAERGIETILQVTCRDRNRIALQSELLAAAALGLPNVLCMSGDPPGVGDHADAKAVFDIDAVGLLRAVQAMQGGADMGGNDLDGPVEIFAGAVANPGAPDVDKEVGRMQDKIEAGASFFQTQGIYEPESFARFMEAASGLGAPVLAGIIVLKSANMARYLNENLPGVFVPPAIVSELESTADRRATSVEIAARVIREVRDMCAGAHVMALGWEARIPRIIESAGLKA